MITIIKYIEEAPDGDIRCTYVDFYKWRILVAISESNWYTEGLGRNIPIWINNKALFIYKFAIRIGMQPK